ncbi:hypothetical protein EIP91_001075 [Steccherinum ochraceum]|uniref:Uncharacterized protein n=1 Tax=Steccherinum ochraceum TaxID=92696 RepID=A0A4V2MWK4_9APHY|nr:hypothetical protein EIP91_001075 [Steccherinum ochraceum]
MSTATSILACIRARNRLPNHVCVQKAGSELLTRKKGTFMEMNDLGYEYIAVEAIMSTAVTRMHKSVQTTVNHNEGCEGENRKGTNGGSSDEQSEVKKEDSIARGKSEEVKSTMTKNVTFSALNPRGQIGAQAALELLTSSPVEVVPARVANCEPLKSFDPSSWGVWKPEEYTAHWAAQAVSREEQIAPNSREAALAKHTPFAMWMKKRFGSVFMIASPRPARGAELRFEDIRAMEAAAEDPFDRRLETIAGTAAADRVASVKAVTAVFARSIAFTQANMRQANAPRFIRTTSNDSLPSIIRSSSSPPAGRPSPSSDDYAMIARARYPGQETSRFVSPESFPTSGDSSFEENETLVQEGKAEQGTDGQWGGMGIFNEADWS